MRAPLLLLQLLQLLLLLLLPLACCAARASPRAVHSGWLLSTLGPLASDTNWHEFDPDVSRLEVWRDDFSDILSVFRWQ